MECILSCTRTRVVCVQYLVMYENKGSTVISGIRTPTAASPVQVKLPTGRPQNTVCSEQS